MKNGYGTPTGDVWCGAVVGRSRGLDREFRLHRALSNKLFAGRIEALRALIPMRTEDAERIRRGLAANGNMSSCSILYSLADHLQQPARHGDTACLLAFDPGFSMEVGVLRYKRTP